MRIKPKYFSSEEGQELEPWPSRPVTDAELLLKRNAIPAGQPCIWIEGIKVHVLIFTDGRAWDALNGWRDGNHYLDWEGAQL